MDFKKKNKTAKSREKTREKDILKNLDVPVEVKEKVLKAFESKIFPFKIEGTGFSDNAPDHSNLKILSPKQILQRLPIAFAK